MGVKELAEKYNDYIIEKRRWFHQYPELTKQEVETTNAIAKELEAMGLTVTRFSGGLQGCYADIVGAGLGPTVLLRADIDALQVSEKTGLPFTSKNEGVMHACGHDGHIAVQLGAAKILCDMKDELKGTVRLFFQPAEEGGDGAKDTIAQGVLGGVSACYGTHIWHALKSGQYNMAMGPRMAATDRFRMTVYGKSAHGSAPHNGHDAVVAAASVIMNLQALVSRFNNPLNTLVLTIGQVEGGKSWNILADEVTLFGTIRTYSRETQATMKDRMLKVASLNAEIYGCTVEMNEYTHITGPVLNDSEDLVQLAQNAAAGLYGKDILGDMERLTGGEDYAFLMGEVPGIYGFWGSANENLPGSEMSNHHPEYTVDETYLYRASAVAAQFALDFLAKG